MKGVRIGIWMTGLNLGLVLLVAAGLVPGGLLLLREIVMENAGARVQLAAAAAVESLRLLGDELTRNTRLLAERPTLLRLLREERADELASFVAQFSGTSRLDGCAVFDGGRLVASTPADAPWDRIGERATDGLHFLEPTEEGSSPLLAARVPLAGETGASALAIRRVDGELLAQLSSQVGLAVRIVPSDGAQAVELAHDGTGWSARRELRSGAEASGMLVEVSLPASEIEAELRPFERRFVAVTCAALLVAIAAGAFAARRLARPLTRLQLAATAIGAGDLATPVPSLPGFETGALASTMESMRRRLQRATAELHQREMEARTLLEGMSEGVFAVDGERRIQSMNPQAARRLGVSVEEAVGRFCGDVLRPAALGGRRPCEDACPIVHARSRGSSRAVEHLELPAGRRTMVITSAPPAGGRQVQLMRDETETEAARRSRDSVLANVSHELKTPLSAQMASIQLLQDALGDEAPPAALELVDSLERSTLRLTRLIDNLLESVRIETGRTTSRAVEVDLAEVVGEAEAMTFPLLRQRAQELALDFRTPLAPVLGDPVQLTQVFVNLLSNANKFSPQGSTIRVGGSSDEHTTSVFVEDAGPGIPASEQGAVFEHSYRSDPTGADGMGLGLWIVKSLVERHSGSVEVGSSGAGGARFTLRFPRAGTA